MLEVYLSKLPSLVFTAGEWVVFWSLIYFVS